MKNLFKTCVWQDKWVHPSESVWGLCHKFRIVNVLSGEEFRVLMKLPPYISSNIQVLNSDFAVYCGRQFKKSKLEPYGNVSLSNIKNGDCMINHRLYYCPECIKDGFHSVYHQISYLDTCVFHPDQKLVKLCDCNYTFSLQATTSAKPFSCPVCHKQMPIPEGSGVLLNQWLRPKEVVAADDLIMLKRNIEFICILNVFQKNVRCILV